LAETETNPLRHPLPDGVVPEEEITRTEDHWVAIMLGLLGVMMGMVGPGSPPLSSAQRRRRRPATLHLGGEFTESNLGTPST
jgi:cytochrome c oxidase subunit 2